MASENERLLSGNFDKTPTNYNNNEVGTSTSALSGQAQSSSNSAERRKSAAGAGGGDYRNIRATAGEGNTNEHQPRREENPFSFKHFLNRDSSSSLGSTSNCNSATAGSVGVLPTPSATPLGTDSSPGGSCPNNNATGEDYTPSLLRGQSASAATSASHATKASSSSSQTSTGARPKVPQSSVTSNHHPSSSISTTSMSSLVSDTPKMKRSPRFSSFDSQASLAEFAGGGTSSPSTFQDIAPLDLGIDKDNGEDPDQFFPGVYDRQFVHRSYSNYDMDMPPDLPGGCGAPSPRRRHSPPRCSNRSSAKNAKSSSSGGILPDFVQDHIIDPWYYNEVINSVDFVEDLPDMANPSEKCQTLPDFLSDGPIIHSSSAHLADVAAGLPDVDSPEDNSPSLQIARLRLENDRLRRELDESRLALAEQTRRSGELERRLEQVRTNESAYNRSLAQSMGQVEENLDQSKKRAAAAQNQVTKLRQQVKQLTAEVETLRRENESLREEGAVGGDRVTRKPSRVQQLSRDLMRAASNAESNLRQLLTGVENLRLMAATIENMDRIAYDSNNAANPVINEEFLSDCDADYEDFSGPGLQ